MKNLVFERKDRTVIETSAEEGIFVFRYLYHEYYQFQPTGTPYSRDEWSFWDGTFSEEQLSRMKPGMSLWCWNHCLDGIMEFTEIKIC